MASRGCSRGCGRAVVVLVNASSTRAGRLARASAERGGRFAAERPTPPPPPPATLPLAVAQGDTAYGVARALGVSLDELQALNPAQDLARLVPGQRLAVPAAAFALELEEAEAPVAAVPAAAFFALEEGAAPVAEEAQLLLGVESSLSGQRRAVVSRPSVAAASSVHAPVPSPGAAVAGALMLAAIGAGALERGRRERVSRAAESMQARALEADVASALADIKGRVRDTRTSMRATARRQAALRVATPAAVADADRLAAADTKQARRVVHLARESVVEAAAVRRRAGVAAGRLARRTTTTTSSSSSSS